MKRALFLLVGALWCAACSSAPLTQLIVAVDTDLMAPGDLDRVEVLVTDPEGVEQSRSAALGSAGSLPVTLGVVHRGGPLGPVTVVARGLLGGGVIVARRATVTMIEGRTMLLELHLESLCIGVACEGETTCETGTCRPVAIDPGELREFDGTIPRYDVDAGSGCLRTEICNGRDDTCDGTIDEGFDFDTDPEHCGGCNVACPGFENAAPACSGGECTIDCESGYGNCDREIRTGCEEDLTTPSMCGECGWICDAPHGTPQCSELMCASPLCDEGYGDCDGVASNGCETLLNDLENCGACDRPCMLPNAMGMCAGGVCGVRQCEEGFDDCDASPGCETELGTIEDCGGCGLNCLATPNAAPACLGTRCGVGACDAGWGNCNGMTGDGCERPLTTITDCRACNFACVLPHATPRCDATGGCVIQACDPGYENCDGIASNGCEQSLEDAEHCGACDNECTGATPLCNRLGTGERVCQSVCGAVLELCGSSCIDTDESLLHCGGCSRPCAPAHASGDCIAGVCGIGVCDAGWGNCDGMASNGCETQLNTTTRCGSCTNSCSIPGATAACTGGVCSVAMCNPMLADCDGMASNGCEQRLDTLTDCGGCDVGCAPAHATGTCAGGTCGVLTCDAGYGNCAVGAGDGCETPLNTLLDCGSCGTDCDLPHAAESCDTRACLVSSCEDGWADCLPAPGCETSITTATHCGSCMGTCGPFLHASSSCATETCVAVCDEGFGDCDTSTLECETPLDTVTNCGACGTPCSVAGATTTCASGTCAIESCTDPATGDCNGSPFDGCEADLQTDALHCGACGTPCDPSTEVCDAGACVPI